MTIENRTTEYLYIDGKSLAPGRRMKCDKKVALWPVSIESDIGRCKIVNGLNKRHITNYENLLAKEGEEEDENGMKNIIVSSLKAE